MQEREEPAEIDTHLVSRKVLLQDMAGMRLFELRDSLKERPADATVAFRMAPQPKFNKNFELLADDITIIELHGTYPSLKRVGRGERRGSQLGKMIDAHVIEPAELWHARCIGCG